jgi:hypothetical protein
VKIQDEQTGCSDDNDTHLYSGGSWIESLLALVHILPEALVVLLDSVVQPWATASMIGGSSPGRGWEFFSSPPRSDRL